MMKNWNWKQVIDVFRAKEETTKNVLLKTYLTSLLSLVLCVSMFLGTSYAWFISEVQNVGNEIYVGTLGVELSKQTEDAAGQPVWASLSELVDGVNKTKLFETGFFWEPGYTALETIRVDNTGDLDFKFVLHLTDGVMTGASTQETDAEQELTLADVAKYFELRVYTHSQEKPYEKPASYEEMIENEDWAYVGTLNDVLEGTVVLEGTLRAAADTGATYTIALHMLESATAEVMGSKIGLNVKLVAYQMPSGKDGLGGENDELTVVSGLKKLHEALNAGSENIVLATDITLEDSDGVLTLDGNNLDGNGSTITYTGERANGSSVGVLTTNGGMVSNLTVNGGDNGRALYVTDLASDLVVSGCTFDGAYAFNLNSAQKTNQRITFTDTVFRSWTSYANAVEHAYFNDCTFEGVLRPYGDTTLVNCTFTGETLDASRLESGESIKLVNCTYDGCLIESAELYRGEVLVIKEGGESVALDSKGMLVLKHEG